MQIIRYVLLLVMQGSAVSVSEQIYTCKSMRDVVKLKRENQQCHYILNSSIEKYGDYYEYKPFC